MHLAHELIDPDADKVVRRLARRGHQAYLVGGCVRDLLLERTPKDFDVATSATPNEIKQLFRNCRIIGRRFRLAHVFFGSKIIETSTFRANPRDGDADEDSELLIRRDNVFGSDIEDAKRRDFTMNGLFYDVETEEVIDHVDGLDDLRQRLVRTIGDPDIRFREDPVRMLRAVKFAARLDFSIESATYAALVRHREELVKCPPPRLLEELYRMLRSRSAQDAMRLLINSGIAAVLSPQLAALLADDVADVQDVATAGGMAPAEAEWAATWSEDLAERGTAVLTARVPSLHDPDAITARRALAWKLIDQLDLQAGIGTEISNGLILAVLVNAFVLDDIMEAGIKPQQAAELTMEVLGPVVEQLRVARRDAERARQILLSQRRIAPSRRRRGRPMALVRRDYFEDSLILYEMTSRALGRDTSDIAQWHQLKSEGAREAPAAEEIEPPGKRRRRRRGGRRRRRTPDARDTKRPSGDQGAAASG
jgi:poly(A) polymerase